METAPPAGTPYTDRMNRLDLTVESPDGRVRGRLRGQAEVSFGLVPGYYDRVTEVELASQFVKVARLLVVARARERAAAVSDAYGYVTHESPALGRRDQEFVARRESIIAEGVSPDGLIRAAVSAMTYWTITIEPGTLASLDEADFLRAAGQVASGLVADQFAQIRAARVAAYG